MLAIERRNKILETLQIEKRVMVSELSRCYQVSEETIRRDLDKLEKDGLVVKSYGGAVLNEHSVFDLPFNIRKNQQVEAKEIIASIVAGMVREGEAIMLDTSSTALYIANRLKEKNSLTVITNSVEVIVNLYDKPEWNVISTGGRIREKSLGLFGPKTDETLASYHVDKAIISCQGLTLEDGFMDSDEMDCSCKRVMIGSAQECILAADSTKFGEIAFSRVASWDKVTYLVTDRKPAERWLRQFEAMNVTCIYPER